MILDNDDPDLIKHKSEGAKKVEHDLNSQPEPKPDVMDANEHEEVKSGPRRVDPELQKAPKFKVNI